MRILIFALLAALASCRNNNQPPASRDTIIIHDTLTIVKCDTGKVYGNERFRNVTVKPLGIHKFLIQGQAQVFEATINWVVEDGHYELKKGFTTADMGAPEWGNFSFIVDAVKKNENSTLHLVLFEISAKDGSRKYELPLVLY